ncbi:lysoplasmalogenase [Bacillus marinisedimentorum]|uniref:lysoplasmalogenase n=1 Tax=Bacillus marinisedimentorum TaxID=1821260 RepID=UPI000872836E|nr:lysoplasmalogenase [Bacillus marinisedimentorum]
MENPAFAFAAAAIISGGVYLAAIRYEKQMIKYILKPGTMVLIILFSISGGALNSIYGWLIIAGLLLSMAGDVFLMLPSDRFLQGLASFFAAHLLYAAAFWNEALLKFLDILPVIAVLFLVISGSMFFSSLKKEVSEEGGNGLLIAVTSYIAVISIMVFAAALTGSTAAVSGALLFYFSDAVLAWNRFKERFSIAEYLVMGSYFGAQLFIAYSVHLLG